MHSAATLGLTTLVSVPKSGDQTRHGRRRAVAGDAHAPRRGGHYARRRRRRRGRGARRAAEAAAAAEGGVLRQELPGGGADRGRLRPAARPPRAHRRARAAPDALPRLLRQGLRRLHSAQLHRRRRGGEGRAAEPDAAWLRPHRPRQGPRRGGLPRRRLLRRRPRARRQGRRRRHWRAVVARADGEEGRHGVDHAGRGARAAVAVDDLPAARRPVHRQGPRRPRPRLAVRCAHHRHRPLLVLRRPPLQLPHRRQRHRGRPAPRRRLRRQPAAAQVQDGRPRRRGGDGPRQPPDVRPRLLPRCAQAQGPVPVRRRAGHRCRGAGRHRRRRGQPAGGVLPGVRAIHGEARRRGGQDRHPGGDQEALRRRQQLDRTEMRREGCFLGKLLVDAVILLLFFGHL